MSHYNEEKQRAEEREKRYQQVLQELRSNEQLKEALKDYRESSVEEFYRDCASDKVRVLEWGPTHIKWHEEAEQKWHKNAFGALEQIQHKKLFDLQCRWRAEQVQLEDICIGADFLRWERDILNCPHIDPVSHEDIDVYRQYMESPDYTAELHLFQTWQDYDMIVGRMSGFLGMGIPQWYEFHNGRTGSGFYLDLPDTRGGKEDHYVKLASRELHKKVDEQKAAQNKAAAPKPAAGKASRKATEGKAKTTPSTGSDNAEASPAVQQPDKRPMLDYHDDDFIKRFVKTYEDEETKKYYWKYMSFVKNDDEDRYGTATEIIKELSEHREVWPMEACDDWYMALHETLHKYNVAKTLDAIPAAYEQFMMYVNAGIQFPSGDNDMFVRMAQDRRDFILKGRVAAGEPENFDF